MVGAGVERILVADADPSTRRWLRELVAGELALDEVDSIGTALERLAAAPPRIVVVGGRLADGAGAELLARAAAAGLLAAQGGPAVFALAGRGDAAPELDEQEVPIYYRLTPALGAERVRELFAQAIAPAPPARPRALADAIAMRQILEHGRRIGRQPDLPSAAR